MASRSEITRLAGLLAHYRHGLTYEFDEVFHRDVFEMAGQPPQLRCRGGPGHIHLRTTGTTGTGSIRTCRCFLLQLLQLLARR